MADTIRAFLGDPAQAEALVRGRGATLIVVCRSANDFTQYRRARADGLAASLYAGKPPIWLEPVPLGVAPGLAEWRVMPAVRLAPRRSCNVTFRAVSGRRCRYAPDSRRRRRPAPPCRGTRPVE